MSFTPHTSLDEEERNVPSDATGDPNSLYNRLGGIYGIAKVVDDFSNNLLVNPKVGANSPNKQLSEWSRNASEKRLAGIKWLRSSFVANVTGGPEKYTGKGLAEAHFRFKITPDEFDEVVKELAKALDANNVKNPERKEVLDAFKSNKDAVLTGFYENKNAMPRGMTGTSAVRCPFAGMGRDREDSDY